MALTTYDTGPKPELRYSASKRCDHGRQYIENDQKNNLYKLQTRTHSTVTDQQHALPTAPALTIPTIADFKGTNRNVTTTTTTSTTV